MTKKPIKSATRRKPTQGKARACNRGVEAQPLKTPETPPERAGRGIEDPSLWCRNRFWWSTVRAHPSTPVRFVDLAEHFLADVDASDRGTAQRALARVDRDGSDPSTRRGDLRGASFVSLIGAKHGYTHTLPVFDSKLWRLVGPEGVGPDELVQLQEALNWELALGARYGAPEESNDLWAGTRVLTGRLYCDEIPLVLGRLGSLQWRSLSEEQFTEVVGLLAARPSWPGLTQLCVLMLRMGDSDARLEVSAVRHAIVSCMRSLSAPPQVDPRVAALFQHLIRRRILSPMRTLEHARPALEWARSELKQLENACRTSADRRWHARQVDALACAVGHALGPGPDWLGWVTAENLRLQLAVGEVRAAINADERAQRLGVAAPSA